MGSLFATKTKQQSSGTNNTQTQNNLWDDPNLQGFLSGYNNQFQGAGNFNVPINPYQTGAANNQQGVAANPQLANGFNTAGNIAQNGFAQGMTPFQNTFENQVVGNMQSDFARQNAEQMDAIRGGAAKSGALGNNTGQNALLMRGAQDAQAKAIANTRMTGFNTAANLANQNTQAQLAGVGQIGNLTGASTNANQAQFGMGQGMWDDAYKNARTPFELYNQGVQGFQGFGNLAGTNTSNQTTGTQTGTQTPGFMQSLMGVAGLGMAGYNWGQGNGWWGGGGGNGGSPSWAANGGVIKAKGFNDGGSVIPPFHANGASESFADKVARAHETVSKLRASGGRTESPKGMGPGRFAEPRVTGDPWKATVRHTTDAEQNDQDPFWSPAQAERMVAWPPFRPMQYEIAGLRGYSAGGAPEPNPQFNGLGTMGARNPEWPADLMGMGQPFNGFVEGVNTPPATAAMDPFGQFPRATPQEGPLVPFSANPNDSSTANVMQAYNPNGPPNIPPQGGMVPTSGPGPVMDPNATTTSAGGPGDRRRLQSMTPNEKFAAMLLSGSPIAGSGKALLDMHAQRIQEHGAELQADQLAQQLAQQNIENQHRRDVLAETTLHNRNTEANRNQNKPETAFDTANAQAAAKAAQENEAAARASQEEIRRLDQVSTLLSNPNMPQGRFADWEVEGRRVAAALLPGVSLDGVSEAEAFRTLSNKMALSMRSTAGGEGMPGAMSDADRTFLMQSVPRLQNTPAGNRLIVDSMRDTAKYRAAVNQEAARYIRAKRSNEGLSEYMEEWMRQNPMTRIVPGHAETRREAERVAQQNAPPPANPAQTPPAAAPAANQPVGSRRRGRDGIEREKRADGNWYPVDTVPSPPTSFDAMGNVQ